MNQINMLVWQERNQIFSGACLDQLKRNHMESIGEVKKNKGKFLLSSIHQ